MSAASIQWTAAEVSSSVIRRVAYDSKQAMLYLEFHKNGATWRYHDVPIADFQVFINAASLGAALPKIKKAFVNERVDPDAWSIVWRAAKHASSVAIDELLTAANEGWLARLRQTNKAVGF